MTLSALLLILSAAFIHASWNLLAKRAGGGAAFVWAAALAGSFIFLPISIALGTFQQVNWNATTLLFLAGSGLLQTLYFVTLQRGYKVGDLSLVYPLARGTGPLFATIGAILLLGERPAPLGVVGATMVVGGIFAISVTAPGTGFNRNWAIGYGLLTGLFIASYTLWDKVAVSALLLPPILYDTISVMIRAALLAPIGVRRWPEVRNLWRDHKWAIIGVGFLSEFAYVLVLTALKTTPVIYVAPMREISILIGTVMGARLLAEGHLRQRLVAASAILLGVIAIAFS
jgi:drug/metabolite transporter (DMT)-like permease